MSLQTACHHRALLPGNHLHLHLDFLDPHLGKGASHNRLHGWAIDPIGRGHVLEYRLVLDLEGEKVKMCRHARDHDPVLIASQTYQKDGFRLTEWTVIE